MCNGQIGVMRISSSLLLLDSLVKMYIIKKKEKVIYRKGNV